jgi:zinc protease
MVKKNLFRPLALLALPFLASAQKINIDIPYEKFVLPNGLTVIVHEDHKAPIVCVNVWYHVGSKNEKPGKTGFAHLFEHLMFNGSENANDDYFQFMERIGATELNGTTSNDRTNYFENVPTNALDVTLFVESDRMGHLLGAIDQKRLDEQRGVVQNEKRQSENQPYSIAEELTISSTYPAGHPYSWRVIGSMADLNAASLKDVQDWFKNYYGAANATIVLAGDIDVKTAREKVTKYFGSIPSGPPVSRYEAFVAKRTGSIRQEAQDRVPQSRIYRVWNVPETGAPDGYTLDLAAFVLGSGKNSRLFKRLVYQDQIATDVQVDNSQLEIAGQFTILASARPGIPLAKVETAIREELALFLKEGPTAAELQRVRTQFLANFLRGIEKIGGFGGKSDLLATGQVFAGDPGLYKIELAAYARATPEDVRRAAVKWLSDGDYNLAIHPFPKFETETSDVDRKKMPVPGPPPALKLPKFERATLSNGMKIILAERHETPVVNFSLNVDAGFASDQFALPGTASMAMKVLQEGTAKRTSLQMSEQLDLLGAQLAAGSNLDTSTVRLSALKMNLDASLEIYADAILHPSFPQAEFERIQKQQSAQIEREKSEPFSMALRVFPTLIYGKGHAYAIPFTGSGTQASLAKIKRDDLAKFHATWFKANNATMIVVGDTTLAEITPRLEKLFGTWKPGEVLKKNIGNVAQREKPAVYLIDQPGAEQSVILAGHIAPPRNNPEEIAMETMNNILGGAFTSRMNMNLREDKHWSYGAGSAIVQARGQQPFIVFAPVQTDKTKESMQEMEKEFRQFLSTKPATAEELAKTQANQTLSLPGSEETINAVSASIAEVVRFGFPDNYLVTYSDKVRALTLKDISAAAEIVIHPNSMVWVVIGDRSKVESGLRDLKFGELHIVDADGN